MTQTGILSMIRERAPGWNPQPRRSGKRESKETQALNAFQSLMRAEACILEQQAGTLLHIQVESVHHKRGYRNLGDFAQEVLRVSPRTARRRLALAKILQKHPGLCEPFRSGRLSLCQVEILAPVLRPESLHTWVQVANGCSLGELRERVSLARREGAEPEDGSDAAAEEAVDADEYRVLRIEGPRSIAPAFQSAIESARSVLGWDAPRSQCFEALLAEAESSFLELAPGAPRSSLRVPLAKCPRAGTRSPSKPVKEVEQLDRVLSTVQEELRDLQTLIDHSRMADPILHYRALEQLVRPLRLLTGRLLGQMRRSLLPSHFHLETWEDVAQKVLQLSARNFRQRIRESALLHRHGLESAYAEGRVSLSQVALLSVLDLSPDSRSGWIKRAQEVTCRQLEREVDLVEQFKHLRWQPDIPEDPASNPGLLKHLESETHRRMLESFPSGVGRLALATLDRTIIITVCLSHEMHQQWQRLKQRIWAFMKQPAPAWVCLIQIIRAAVTEWERVEGLRRPLVRRVLERDQYHCTVPGCSSRERLEVHHIVFRSRGGLDTLENLTTLCAFHHRFGIHEGHLGLRGRAESRLYWKLGGTRQPPSAFTASCVSPATLSVYE